LLPNWLRNCPAATLSIFGESLPKTALHLSCLPALRKCLVSSFSELLMGATEKEDNSLSPQSSQKELPDDDVNIRWFLAAEYSVLAKSQNSYFGRTLVDISHPL
jgi:hypothetical protein